MHVYKSALTKYFKFVNIQEILDLLTGLKVLLMSNSLSKYILFCFNAKVSTLIIN